MCTHLRNHGFNNAIAHFEWKLFLGERQDRPHDFFRNPNCHRNITQYWHILYDQAATALERRCIEQMHYMSPLPWL